METSVIVTQNPWWKLGAEFASYDHHLKTIRESFIDFRRNGIDFQKGNIYLILGPRQVGKTVWLKNNISKLLTEKGVPARSICYFSCDTLSGRSRRELMRAIDFMIDRTRDFECTYLFLDEITYVQEWGHVLKELSDSGKTSRLVVIATGSSPASLKKETETLPGRGLSGNQYFIKPLTFRDFALQTSRRLLNHDIDRNLAASLEKLVENPVWEEPFTLGNINSLIKMSDAILPFKKELDYLFDFYLITGGFPKVINNYFSHLFLSEKKEQRIDAAVYEDFSQAIFGELQKMGYREDIIKQVLSGIIAKTGNHYSYSKLVQDGDSSAKPTIINYVYHLKDSFILNLVLSYDFRQNRIRQNGNKKIYFSDPFILASIRARLSGADGFSVSEDFCRNENKIGYLIETIAAQHLISAFEIPISRTSDTFLWFHYNTREIDFICKDPDEDGYTGIETAYQWTPKVSDTARISQISKYIMLTRDEYDVFTRASDVLMMPASIFLALLEKSERSL